MYRKAHYITGEPEERNPFSEKVLKNDASSGKKYFRVFPADSLKEML
jgi:hypothetical protein